MKPPIIFILESHSRPAGRRFISNNLKELEEICKNFALEISDVKIEDLIQYYQKNIKAYQNHITFIQNEDYRFFWEENEIKSNLQSLLRTKNTYSSQLELLQVVEKSKLKFIGIDPFDHCINENPPEGMDRYTFLEELTKKFYTYDSNKINLKDPIRNKEMAKKLYSLSGGTVALLGIAHAENIQKELEKFEKGFAETCLYFYPYEEEEDDVEDLLQEIEEYSKRCLFPILPLNIKETDFLKSYLDKEKNKLNNF